MKDRTARDKIVIDVPGEPLSAGRAEQKHERSLAWQGSHVRSFYIDFVNQDQNFNLSAPQGI
jgi:hypothetical protein